MLRLLLDARTTVPPYSRTGIDGRWNQLSPTDVTLVEQSSEGKGEKGGGGGGQDDVPFYSMINGISISGERIDLMPPTKILIHRKRIKELRHKLAK